MSVLDLSVPITENQYTGTYSDINAAGNHAARTVPVALLLKTNALARDISSLSLDEGWLYTSLRATDDQDADQVIILLSGPTEDLFRIVTVDTVASSGSQKAQYWNGSAWTDIGTFSTCLTGLTAQRIDIHWKIADSGGEFTVYVGGTSEVSMTGDTKFTADTTIDTFTLGGVDTGSNHAYAYPVVIADADSRGLELAGYQPVSNGNYTEFTGGEPEVDGWLNGSTSDFAVGDANGERMTLNFSDIDVFPYTGYSVAATAIVFLAKAQSDPGLYIKPLMRKSSTDYNPSGSFQPGSPVETAFAYTMLTDPSTGSAWADQAAVNDAEFGLEMSSTA